MKIIGIDVDGVNAKIERPDNCMHPVIYPKVECKAVNNRNPECDCRWCVFNKEFNRAGEK